MRPIDPIKKKKTIERWNLFVRLLREFFTAKNFIEIRTPTLVTSPGLEPFLDPFETEFQFGNTVKPLYLPTSPEFHLKKALCYGYKNIFELKECFRNGEVSPLHQPEFLMLEWYRTGKGRTALWRDINDLFLFLDKAFLPSKKKSKKPRTKTLQIIKMEKFWKDCLNFDLTPRTSLQDLKLLCRKQKELKGEINFDFESESDFDDLFNLIWIEWLEPKLKAHTDPVIIWHYPPSQAALSKLTPEGWADRFELYWQGYELANAFTELNDPVEQRKRFLADQRKKVSLGKKIVPIDDELIALMEKGMPASVGIALGVERLFMVYEQLESINELRLFPFQSQK